MHTSFYTLNSPLEVWGVGVGVGMNGRVFGYDPPICQNTTQQWGSSGWLFNEFYDTLNLLDLTAI